MDELVMRNIILFCGHISSGKDTAAQYFMNQYNFSSTKMAGAVDRVGSLKRVVFEIFDLDMTKVEDRTYRETPHPNLGGKTPRQALQYFGDETRKFHKEVWVNNTKRHIDTLGNKNFVVTDIRYFNEFDIFEHMNNENTRVTSIAIINPMLDLRLPIYQDPSEYEIEYIQDKCQYKIVNDRTVEDLYKNLDRIANIILH